MKRGRSPNLYDNPVRGITYYRYRHPATGQWHSMGRDYAKANEAAKILDARLLAGSGDVEARVAGVLGGKVRFRELMETYLAHLEAYRNKRGHPYAPGTMTQYRCNLARIERIIGPDKAVDAIGRADVAKVLNDVPDSLHNAFRSLMVRLFDYARPQGWRDGCLPENPAEEALVKTVAVKRHRLLLEWFQAIHAEADPWYQVAMDLGLQTLQRREDLVVIRYDDEREPGQLFVDQIKLRGRDAGHISIGIGPELREVIERSRDHIACPFIIHARPGRLTPKQRSRKEHWAQVPDWKITEVFAGLRDVVPEIAAMEPRRKPTFHEIRSLGADLYRKAGRPESEIQALLGHTDLATTRTYLDRRGAEVQYQIASAGLALPA